MLCNAGESKSIFVDVQDPCLQPPNIVLYAHSSIKYFGLYNFADVIF